jgi:DNA-binding transcriptional ArsR family regulator
MDILNLLGTLKGKALDLKDIELLKHAYELQEENIKQLKTSNESYRESMELLRSQSSDRQNQIVELKSALAGLQTELETVRKQIPAPSNALPPECSDILRHLANNPDHDWWNTELARLIGKPLTAVDHYLDVLKDGDYVYLSWSMNRDGTNVDLAARGREYAVKQNLVTT